MIVPKKLVPTTHVKKYVHKRISVHTNCLVGSGNEKKFAGSDNP